MYAESNKAVYANLEASILFWLKPRAYKKGATRETNTIGV